MPDYEGVFRQIKGPVAGSDAPGTGPTSTDTDTASNRAMGSGGGVGHVLAPRIPPAARRNQQSLGYGGGGESTLGKSANQPQDVGERPASASEQLAALLRKSPPGPAVPQFNRIYDSFRSEDGWRYAADAMASGTIVSPANGASVVAIPVTIATNLPQLRLSQFPGGTQVAIYLRTFQAQVTVTTMTGVLDWFYTDPSGFSSTGLGTTSAAGAASGLISVDALMLSPVIDMTGTAFGTIFLNAVNIATTAGNIAWRLCFSYAYILPEPAFKGYVPLPIGSYNPADTNTVLDPSGVYNYSGTNSNAHALAGGGRS